MQCGSDLVNLASLVIDASGVGTGLHHCFVPKPFISTWERQMPMGEDQVAKILEAIERIDGIVLLDLAGLKGTWKEHIDDLYREVNRIRSVCEGELEEQSPRTD